MIQASTPGAWKAATIVIFARHLAAFNSPLFPKEASHWLLIVPASCQPPICGLFLLSTNFADTILIIIDHHWHRSVKKVCGPAVQRHTETSAIGDVFDSNNGGHLPHRRWYWTLDGSHTLDDLM